MKSDSEFQVFSNWCPLHEVWGLITRLNVCTCRYSSYDMLRLGWRYDYESALLLFDTLVKRCSIVCTMFIFDIQSGVMKSPSFLSAPDLNTS
jgi:hypothetical protein